VLDAVDDPWAEHRRMDEILWRHNEFGHDDHRPACRTSAL
jgi:hypothetical protein